MQKRTHMQISSLIVFLSILTILMQFMAYYFFISTYLIIGLAILITILCTHILLEQSLTYESIFIYSLLIIFISVIIAVFIFFGRDQYFVPYTDVLLWIIMVNWFLPTLHCYIRNMSDYGTRIENFNPFYRNNSIIFLLFYFGIIIYGSFAPDAFPWAYRALPEDANFAPFLSVATQIEDYLNHMIPVSDVIWYLISRILAFFPYGFYCILLFRRRSRALRFLTLFFVPVILEFFQYIFIPIRCDIDDVLYALIGGMLGALWFHLNNVIYHAISGKNFLSKESDFRYSNSSLHF